VTETPNKIEIASRHLKKTGPVEKAMKAHLMPMCQQMSSTYPLLVELLSQHHAANLHTYSVEDHLSTATANHHHSHSPYHSPEASIHKT
jgi:hypothetical protein